MSDYNHYKVNNEPKPLDNDALTRFVYLHDDDITQLIAQIHSLERRVQELEEQLREKSEKILFFS